MSAIECARAVVPHFPESLWVTMVAIAGPESGYNRRAAGDPYTFFSDHQQPAYREWSCNVWTAFGYFQINLRWNYPTVRALMGSQATPCEMAEWLFVPTNSARAARAIYNSQGLGAWSTYNARLHEPFIPIARAAVLLASGFGILPPEVAPVDPAAVAVEPPDVAVEPPAVAVLPPGV